MKSKEGKIRISQSLIKRLKENDCPKKIKALYIDDIPSNEEQSKSLLYGSYFETGCIGSGARGKKVKDLPRLQSGNKSTDHVRIDQQIEKFKEVVIEHDVVIDKVQYPMLIKYNDKYNIGGEIDFTGSFLDDKLGKIDNAIIDIKLTKTIYASYGDWSWHFPHNMDHTQAYMYTILYEQIHGETPPFYYWIFDYKPEPEMKIIRKKFGSLERAEINESIRSAAEKLDYYEASEWFTKPGFEACKPCPLKDACDDYKGNRKIEVV